MTRSSSAELPRTAKPSCSSLRRISGIAHRLDDFGIQPGDNVLRRAGRRQDRKPGIEEEPGQTGFRNGGHIRKLRQSALRGHPDQSELAAAYQRRDGPETLKSDGDLTGWGVGRSLGSAFVGHVGQRYASARL